MRTLQCKNLLVRVHDCRIRTNGATQDIVGVGKVYNHDLVLLANLFADTYEVVGFKCEGLSNELDHGG